MSKLKQPYHQNESIFTGSRDVHATAIPEFKRTRPPALCSGRSDALGPWGHWVYIAALCDRPKDDQAGYRGVKKNELLQGRIRRPGAGRKAQVIQGNQLSSAFEQVMEFYRAGNPMNASVRFTYLCVREIVEKLRVLGQLASPYIVTLLLNLQGFGKRKMQKKGTACTVEGRNEQFEYIAQLVREFNGYFGHADPHFGMLTPSWRKRVIATKPPDKITIFCAKSLL